MGKFFIGLLAMIFTANVYAQIISFPSNYRVGHMTYYHGTAGLTAADVISSSSVGGNLMTWMVCRDPAIGTAGSDIGAASASTDISGGTDTDFKVTVDGGTEVTASLTVTGLNTGALIAAAMETEINTELASQGTRVRVVFDDSDDHYEIYSLATGTSSSVVVVDGASNNVADDLKIGAANGATEAAGTAANGSYIQLSSSADPSTDGIQVGPNECFTCPNCTPKLLKDLNVIAGAAATGYSVIQYRQ